MFGRLKYISYLCSLKHKAMKKKMFLVEVTRTSYSTKSFKVLAEDQQSANDTALDAAGNYEFPEHDSDYSATDSHEIAAEHVNMYSSSIDLTKE
jgi:hypothetical protein